MKHFRALTTTFESPDAIDDATEVYGGRERYEEPAPAFKCECGGTFLTLCGVTACTRCSKVVAR